MKNKLITLLCALMACSWASAYDINLDGIYYDILDETSVSVTYQTTNYNTYRGDVNVPATITYNGVTYTVTTIGQYAFRNCENELNVTLPETLTTISSDAFYGATGLQSIKIASATTIGSYAFSGCTGLKDIVLPSNLNEIGKYAFQDCSSITSLVIPGSVTKVSYCAFYNTSALTDLTISDSDVPLSIINTYYSSDYEKLFYNSPLTNLYIGRDISYSSDYSPFKKSTIKNVTIGRGMTTIPNHLLRDTAIETLDIPSNIVSIGTYAFYNCVYLLRVTIGANVLSIGWNAFGANNNIAKVFLLPNTVPDGVSNISGGKIYVANTNYASYFSDAVVYKLLSSMFTVGGVTYVPTSFSARTCDAIDCTYNPEDTEINIGATVEYEGVTMNVDIVGDYALYKNKYIVSAKVANRRHIGQYAFSNCPALLTAEISNGDYIDSYAFSECSTLASVTLSNKSYIGQYAFSNNPKLNTVRVTESVSDIWEYAFYKSFTSVDGGSATLDNTGDIKQYAFQQCSGLTTLSVGPTVNHIGNYAFSKAFRHTSEGTAILNNKGTLGYYAFSECTNLAGAVLCEDITDIGEYCFYKCSSLSQVNIPECITEIKRCAFYGTSSLQHITLPAGLLTIGESAFESSGLVDLRIPATTTLLDNYAFYNTKSLADLHIEDSDESLSVGYGYSDAGMFRYSPLEHAYIGRQLTYKTGSYCGYSPFASSPIKHVTFGDLPKTMAEYMFYQCKQLESAHLGTGLQSIGQYSFYKCESLSDVNVPEGNTVINPYTFYGCKSLQQILLPESMTKIDEWAFANSGLLSITIPAATTEIKNSVFNGCTNLALFEAADGEQLLTLGYNDSNKGLFYDCHLNKVILGRELSYPTSSSYGYSPFYRNAYLREVVVTDIPVNVNLNEFYGCTALTDVTIGDGVTAIGNYAFSGCTALTNFLFGESLATIGDEAFSDCTAMVKLYSQATVPPTCGSQALDDINKWRCTLYIPNGTYNAYVSAQQWMEFLKVANTNVETGDANADGRITVADVSTVVDHVLGYEPLIDLTAADANGDGSVLISDATAIVRMILGTWQSAAKAPEMVLGSMPEHRYQLALDNHYGSLSAQMDILLPEGAVLRSVELSGDNALTHTAGFSMIGESRARVVVISLDNTEIASAELLRLTIESETVEAPVAEQVYVVTREDGLLVESNTTARVTGIDGATSAIGDLDGSATRISVNGLGLTITSTTDRTIVVTDMLGRSTTIDIHAGDNTLTLPAAGVYVVDGQKIAVK